MGLFLHLHVSEKVSADAWAKTWDESMEVLKRFPAELVAFKSIETDFGERWVWSRNLTAQNEGGSFWRVDGDADSQTRLEAHRHNRLVGCCCIPVRPRLNVMPGRLPIMS